MSSQRLFRPLPLLGFLALVMSSCFPAPRHSDVKVGLPIPEFELTSLDGETVSSHSYAGTPVVLNFWATWCGPCVREIPTLKAIERDSAARVVSIAIDQGGAGEVRPFAERHGIDYAVLLGDSALFKRFNGWAIPYTLVLDSSLRIVRMHRGLVSLRTLERDLRRAQEASTL